ncbi:hypothetical protein MIND_00242300 [Mycena indigotica]|uniref:Uncharacterized protein n=1 Tax=Mycena indigotica TaxID=2126181 RepID=A0A8H6T746_9AGAR|nr:uncharacterized protein MIND_00242300 [Mycena indigotica]KAF7312293.1 hypothetical protein MIND_00242300 [Mycena indigotica]
MFTTLTVLLVSLLSLTSVFAKPLSFRRDQALAFRNAPAPTLQARGNGNVSFSNFNNIASLQGFDDFNGLGNFRGDRNSQTVVVKETQVQCQDIQIEFVQQRLAILQEVAKRHNNHRTSQTFRVICNVETQTIVLAQHNGALEVFRDDIQRKTVARQIGFDEQIVSKFSQIFQQDGSLSVVDAGFSGKDVGKNLIVPFGNDWDNDKSPQRQPAIDAAIIAASTQQ